MNDIRYALRVLWRGPLFTMTAVITLALGIGANAAVFSVIHGVMLAPLPFADPDRLVIAREHLLSSPTGTGDFSYPDFLDIRESASTLASLAALPTAAVASSVLEVNGVAAPVFAHPVSAGFFEVLGTAAALGRVIESGDDLEGAEPVVVLGDGLWRRRFGGTPGAIGQRVSIAGVAYTVVGVMPHGFELPVGVEAWVPLGSFVPAQFLSNRTVGFLRLVGRLAPGATVAQADAEVDAITRRLSAANSPPTLQSGGTVESIEDSLFGATRPALLVLFAGAGLVLLIACANLANLALARAAGRRRELAIRAALGASRSRIARQLLTEALVLSVAGGVAGVWLCLVGIDSIVALGPRDLYRADAIAVDASVLAYAFIATMVAAALSGMLPALQGSRAGATDMLTGAGRSTEGVRGRALIRGVLVAQVALAVVLLAAGGLLTRSLLRLRSVDLGIERAHALTAEVFLPDAEYPAPGDVYAFYDDLLGRARSLPGVDAAAGVLLRPLEGPDGYNYSFTIEGRAPEGQTGYPTLNYEAVTADYFRALGIPVIAGRPFDTRDGTDAPGVVIISAGFARHFWPGADPVGARIKWGAPESQSPWLTVVGVVGDARYRGLETISANVYVPAAQAPWRLNHIVVRTAGDPAALAGPLRRLVSQLGPGARLVNAATIDDLVSRALRRPRFHTVLIGLFAAIALILAAVGIYGVVAYVTAQRTAELGVRMALGATAEDIWRLVVRDGLRTTGAGLLIGIAGALAAGRMLRSLLYGIGAGDPLTLAAVTIGLGIVALAAACGPAIRAMRIDPLVAMRSD